MNRQLILTLILVQLFVGGFLWAQSDRAAITGTVTDVSGGVVPGVRVTAINVDTQVQTTATTNDVGIYSILNLPIGSYSVTFALAGFKTYERQGITLQIKQVAQVDVQMQVGETTDSVTVTADANILPTGNTDLGTHMRGLVVKDLPLAIDGGRSLEGFGYAITPAVEGNSWTSYIAGGPAFSKEVLIDGTSTIVQFGGWTPGSPSLEAVEEFKVETSGIRAEDGRTAGGVFKFNLKSGTNDLHGSVFGFHRNEAFNANTWNNNFLIAHNSALDPANRAKYEDQYRRPFDRRWDYGFSLGGPVIKDKTFLFAALEQYRQEEWHLGGFYRTVPIPEFLNGDFSRLLNTDAEPLGTDAGGNPIYPGAIIDPHSGLVFPGNVIPGNRISAPSKIITDIYRQQYPPMVAGALINNTAALANGSPSVHNTQFSLKADHYVSEKLRLSGSVIYTEAPGLMDYGGLWNPNDPNKTGGPFAWSEWHGGTTHSYRFSPTYSFTPTLLNTLTLTYNGYRNPGMSTTAEGGWSEKLGFREPGIGTFPEIAFGDAVNGVYTDAIGDSASWVTVDNIYMINDSLSWVKGRHVLKFGGEARWMQINSHSGYPANRFEFSNHQTGAPQADYANQVGFGFASFLLGEVYYATERVPIDLYGRRQFMTLWAQDDFKLRNNLTLTMDLRWEATTGPTEKYGHWANFEYDLMNTNYNIPGALAFAKDGNDSFMRNKDWKEFSPHFGIAWQPSQRFVVRAAYGIFYTPLGLNFHDGVPYSFAPHIRGTNQVGPTADLSPAFNWTNGYPGNFKPGTKDPNYIGWPMVRISPDALHAGYIQQWNGGVEFALDSDTRLGIQYSGNKGSRLQSDQFERNQADPAKFTALLKSGHEWDWVWDQESANASGVPYPYAGFSGFAYSALFPYPLITQAWAPLYVIGVPKGSSDYQSLQFTLTRRSTRGLAADISYNLSRARSNADNAFEQNWWNGGFQDVTKLDEEAKVVAAIDQTHVFKGYVSWELPFGTGRALLGNASKWLNGIVGGWTLSGIFRYSSGQALGIYSSNWYSGWDAMIYANVDRSKNYSRKFDSSKFNAADVADPKNRYFDTSGITNPAYGEFGTGPRALSALRGFGAAREDVAIMKNIKIGETKRLQFRLEFYNPFNRHDFYNPESNLGSPNYGHVYTAGDYRRIGQIGVRFDF